MMELSELINFQSNRNRLENIRNNRKNIIPFNGNVKTVIMNLY